MKSWERKFIHEFKSFRMCGTKRHYQSENDAMGAAMSKKNNPKQNPMKAYNCPHCKEWHVARKRER